MLLKIPKYNEVDPEIRKIDLDDLFNLIMSDLATHSIHDALGDMVVYVQKGKVDLSKELLSLSKHPRSLSIPVKVANKICSIQYKKFNHEVEKVMKNSYKPSYDKSPRNDSHVSKEFDDSDGDEMNYFKNKINHYIKSHSLTSLDIVAVDRDNGLLDIGLNDENSVGNIVLGLEDLKLQIIRHLDSSSHGSSRFPDYPTGGNSGPSSDNPIDQANDILNYLGY